MNEPKLMGNGEGHTVLILTDAESRLIRAVLGSGGPGDVSRKEALAAYGRGCERGAERITAEFNAEQKARKAARG